MDIFRRFLGLRAKEIVIDPEKKCDIGFLVLWVGTKCSLRCRDCGNLIPYAKQESFDMEKVISDLRSMLKLCNVSKLQIQGGSHSHTKILINSFER